MTSTNSHDHYQVLTEEHLEPSNTSLDKKTMSSRERFQVLMEELEHLETSNTYKTLFIYSVPLGTIPKS